MKKMICDICSSQQIKKVGDVFVCQDCGTEYGLEEAKALLKEVGEGSTSAVVKSEPNKQNEKDKLIGLLYCWAKNISLFPDLKVWFNIDPKQIYNDEFWNQIITRIFKGAVLAPFKKMEGVSFNSIYYELERFYDYHSDNKYIGIYLDEKCKGTPKYKAIYSFLLNLEKNDYLYKCKNDRIYAVTTDQYRINKPLSVANSMVGGMLLLESAGATLWTKGFIGKKRAPQDIEEKFNSILKMCKKTLDDFVKEHNSLMEYYESHYGEVCDVCKDIYDNCTKLESELYLPYNYRSVPVILDLIGILKDGKASTWQEVLNLYDTHQFRAGVYEKLDVINNKLDNIQQTLVAGFTAVVSGLNAIQSSLQSINSKMNQINQNVNKIKKCAYLTMWSIV